MEFESSIDNFRGLTRLLEQIKALYHTFAFSEAKTLRVVIRGISIGIPSQDVLEDLQDLGFEPFQLSRMNRLERQLPLVLAEVPLDKKLYAASPSR